MKKLEEMTLQEKIGQLIIVGFPSPYYDENLKTLVEKYKCGNVIMFTRNFQNASQMKKLCTDVHNNIYKETGLYPFISIDQEGGLVTRLMKDVTFPPSQMTSSASAIPNAPYLVGKMIGRDMIRLGLNIDLAPCLEINPNLENELTNVRSYSSDPVIAGKYAHDFIKGLKENEVLGCAKHFPGAGDDKVDSHLELPIIDIDKETMHKTGLVPFKENLDVPCIMTTHTLFTVYDTVPATLSKNILKGLLRSELNYQGLIMSDCMEMKAIADHYGSANGALMSLKAGCDFVLVCHTFETQVEAFEKVYQAALNNELTIEEINEKVERIIKFKEMTLPYLEKYFFNDNEYQVSIENNVLASTIVDKSLTKILGNEPILTADSLVLTPKASVSSIVEDEFDDRSLSKVLHKEFPNTKVYEFSNDDKVIEKIKREVTTTNNIIIFSYDVSKDEKQKNLINEILRTGKECYVISLKGPMDQKEFVNLKNYLCLYEYTPNSIKTIVKYLKKELKPEGKLPK